MYGQMARTGPGSLGKRCWINQIILTIPEQADSCFASELCTRAVWQGGMRNEPMVDKPAAVAKAPFD